MNLAILIPITVVVIANTLYHISSKGIPADQSAYMGLIVNYATALMASIVLYCFTPHGSTLTELARTNWACILMGLSITGIEAGFLLIYRMGGQLSTISLVVNILLSIVMLIVGISFYHEALTATKIIGAILCTLGIIVISL